MDYKEELRNLIDLSDLEHNKKQLWELFLKISYPEEDEAVFEAVNESEKNLRLLTNHLGDKIRSMKDSNPEKWQNLTESEKIYVNLY